MSYLAAAAIQTRLREVLVQSLGTARTVPSARYKGGLDEAPQDARAAISALSKPTVEVGVRVAERSGDLSLIATTWLWRLEVEVVVSRLVNVTARLSDAARDAIMAAIVEDADVIAQALSWPGNLTTTSGGTPTGIVSGCLVPTRTTRAALEDTPGSVVVRATVELEGRAISTPAAG